MTASLDKAIQDVISAHKVGFTMLPVLEALSVNMRDGGINNLKFKDAFAQISARSSSTFHYLVKELNLPSDKQDALMAKLMYIYANVLANEIILYGNDNLNSFDEVFKVFLMANKDWLFVEELTRNHNDKYIVPKYDLGIAKVEAAMLLFNSVWVFHNNLYIGGFIKLPQLNLMNEVATEFLLRLVSLHVEVVFDESSHADKLRPVFWMFCSQLVGKAMVSFENRIIESADDVQLYIKDPAPFFKRLEPLLVANLNAANKAIELVINELGEK